MFKGLRLVENGLLLSQQLDPSAQRLGVRMIWGQLNTTFEVLERSVQTEPWELLEINTFWFEPLRSEPRFQDLLTALQGGELRELDG